MRKLAIIVCSIGFASVALAHDILESGRREGTHATLQKAAGNAMTIQFSVKDASVRANAIAQIKGMVGNPLKSTQSSTINGNTTLRLSPVNDAQGFIEKLKEIGTITKSEGTTLALKINPAKVKAPQSDVAKDAGNAIELKSDKGSADYAGAILKTDAQYMKRRHKLLLVELEAGKTYQVEMKSARFSCCLFLEDPNGTLLAKNGPNGGVRDARLTITAKTAGKYRIIAGAFGLAGDFTLSVRKTK